MIKRVVSIFIIPFVLVFIVAGFHAISNNIVDENFWACKAYIREAKRLMELVIY